MRNGVGQSQCGLCWRGRCTLMAETLVVVEALSVEGLVTVLIYAWQSETDHASAPDKAGMIQSCETTTFYTTK